VRGRQSPEEDWFAEPRAYVDVPAAGDTREPGFVQVFGWCMFPGSIVARVDVEVGDAPPRPARIAMPRADVPELTDRPTAPISGFELMADLTGAEPGTEVTITAVAHGLDGREVAADPVAFTVAEPVHEDDGSAERATTLRERAEAQAPARLRARDEGLRLVAFSHQLPYGGASLYMVEVLRRFARKPGFSCTVVTLQDGPLRDELEDMGIRVHVTDGFPVTSPDRYEGNQAELLAWASAQQFDVAFVNTLGSFSGADVATRLGIPMVWAVHESFDLPLFWSTAFPPDSVHPYAIERAERSLRSAEAVIFEAEATRRLFLPYADAGRLITAPYGIELEEIRAARGSFDRAALRRGLGLADDARVILCLGTIEARKSQSMLAAAFSAIADRHPDAVLALVGEVDADWCAPYARSLRQFAERSGLGDRLRIEPITADPHPWHMVADFHACASDLESLPRSLLEAMAFETPIVSTDVFGVTEIIEDGVTGYRCATRDAAGLTHALDRALSAEPAELRRVARAAAELVAVRHEPAGYAERLWDLFVALARDPHAQPRPFLAVSEEQDGSNALALS
jgi:glycosyltransferase involved in cell wall biosynthesis